MKHPISIGLLGLALGASITATAYNPKNLEFTRGEHKESGVIFKDGDFSISYTGTQVEKDVDDSHLYYIKIPNQDVIEKISGIVKPHYADETQMVIETEDPILVNWISNILHQSKEVFCGGLQWVPPGLQVLKADQFPREFHADKLTLDQKVKSMVERVDSSLQKDIVLALEDFGTRHANTSLGEQSADWIFDQFKSIAGNRKDIEFEQVGNRRSGQKSVITRIVGQKNPEKIVILGAHIDSTAFWNRNNAPGADDNATGTAAIMEAFRILIESGQKFEHTIEFHGYAAEELGLIGSSELASQYRKEGRQVISMMQLDMNGFVVRNNEPRVTLVSNNTNADLTDSLAKLTDLYLDIPYAIQTLSGGSSDHAAWNRQGYPASFPTEDTKNYNSKIHTGNDTSNILDFEMSAEFTKLAVAYLGHLGVII